MEVTTNPNNTNTFPNILTLHIYKTILLFIPYFSPVGRKTGVQPMMKLHTCSVILELPALA